MYGKSTRLRIGKETVWGQAPSSGWVALATSDGKASLSPRVNASRYEAGAVAGPAYAAANFQAPATAANLTALAEAGLWRDENGQMASFTLVAADAGGARDVRGAMARRMKVRSGIARPALEFAFEFAGKVSEPAASFDPAAAAKPFTFAGASVSIDSGEVAAKEFSIGVNNNIFIGPSDDDFDASFFTAGRQELTGYVILGDDRRDLVDGDAHSFAITLPGAAGDAAISAGAVFFTWCREIRSITAGALAVLYFEGASGGIASGLTIELTS
jgi:hypothetical protein